MHVLAMTVCTGYPAGQRNNAAETLADLTNAKRLADPASSTVMHACGFRAKWGTDSGGKWGGISTEVGRGFDGKWGTLGCEVVMVPHFLRNDAPSISEGCPTSIGT